MKTIQKNLINLNKKIISTINKNHLLVKKITIVVVSKNQKISNIKHAILLGQKHFGENYIQESINKIQELEKFTEITWHFIGKVQSKKAKQVAQNFSWCQSIDREKIAILLNQYRPIKLPKLNVLIQINFFNDTKKNGIHIEECDALAKKISLMQNLNLRGIMIMPILEKNIIKRIENYKKIYTVFKNLQKKYISIDTLSLGTSFDLEEALIANSNMIRIGRSIFK